MSKPKSRRNGEKSESRSESTYVPETWRGVLRYVAVKVTDTITGLFKPDSVKWVMMFFLGVGILNLIYIALLPENERLNAQPLLQSWLSAATSHLASESFLYVGWTMFGLSLLVFVPTTTVIMRRNHSQGKQLAEYRRKEEPDRLSSRDEVSLADYDAKMKERYDES